MKSTLSLCIVLLSTLGACRVTYGHTDRVDNIQTGVLLAEAFGGDVTTSWRLFPGGHGDPRIQIESTVTAMEPSLGLTVVSLTATRARPAGLEPFSGVVVASVEAGSAAAEAGLERRDVITELAGRPVTTPEQFSYVWSEEAVIGESIELTVTRRERGDDEGFEHSAVLVTPRGVSASTSRSESIALKNSDGLAKFTGLGAAMVPAAVAEDIYDTAAPVPIVTGVITGSPAYLAGLRCGDRILAVDGEPVQSLRPLRQAVLALLARDKPQVYTWDLRDDGSEVVSPAPDDKDSILIQVDSPTLGPYAAQVAFEPDFLEQSEFFIPILFNYQSAAWEHESGFLNFIFTFGYDHESSYLPSASRAPARISRTVALPLGLVQVERSPEATRWTLLWFIRWRTDR